MDNKLFIINWEKVTPQTMQLLKSGQAGIYNGVARNTAENFQIIQHMPFEQTNLPQKTNLIDIAKAAQSTQTAIGSMLAMSTVAIMGTVIISTAYLSHKLNKIQKAIDILQKELHDQNIVHYTERITSYFGVVEATLELIKEENIVEECPDLILLKISELSNIRNQLILFLDNLISLSDSFTPAHKSLAIDFINMTFNLIPKGIFIESQAAYKIEKFYLGDTIRKSGHLKYNNSMQNYRDWINNKYELILKGNVDSNTEAFQNKFQVIKSLVTSEENKLLLENSI